MRPWEPALGKTVLSTTEGPTKRCHWPACPTRSEHAKTAAPDRSSKDKLYTRLAWSGGTSVGRVTGVDDHPGFEKISFLLGGTRRAGTRDLNAVRDRVQQANGRCASRSTGISIAGISPV
jgi:hypothetical protein